MRGVGGGSIAAREAEYAKFPLLELPCPSIRDPSHPRALFRPAFTPLTCLRLCLCLVQWLSGCLTLWISFPSPLSLWKSSGLLQPFSTPLDSVFPASLPRAGPLLCPRTNVAKFSRTTRHSLAVQQSAGAVGRPLDLAGRNSRLAGPVFHPPVAFRRRFSQSRATMPQHLAQALPHRGFCNCDFFCIHFVAYRSLPLCLYLPLSPSISCTAATICSHSIFPMSRCHANRVTLFPLSKIDRCRIVAAEIAAEKGQRTKSEG